MGNKIKRLFRKICEILFRKKARRTIWGRKFDGSIRINSDVFVRGDVTAIGRAESKSNKVAHFTLRDDSIACRRSKSY